MRLPVPAVATVAATVEEPPVPIDRPRTLPEALDALAAAPAADLVAGGTDYVLAVRSGTRRPPSHVISLSGVVDLRARGIDGDALTVGAGVTYAELAGWSPAPGLAATARTVGTPQVRNVGTVGGALGTANPRGDLLTFLRASDATVRLAAAGTGMREVALGDFLAGGRRQGELVASVRLPRPPGPAAYLKIGGRQAASIAVLSCALVVDLAGRRVGCALGAGSPAGPVRAVDAEVWVGDMLDWADPRADPELARRFGRLVAAALGPADGSAAEAAEVAEVAEVDEVDEVDEGWAGPGPAGAAAQRWYRHAAGVLAARALTRCLPDAAV